MKRLLTACAVIGLCISIRVSAQSEVGYRANIGKLAVSAANGTEIGRIVDVVMMNGIWVYKVRHEGKISASPVETIVAKGVPQGTAKTPSVLTSESNIDPLLERTATAFREELFRHEGTLHALLITPKGISARWSSAKCQYFESELIDLLLSVKRTQTASPAITGTHTCQGKLRAFTVTGETFHMYRTGAIAEEKVLAAVK